MSLQANYFKLGLFVIGAIVIMLVGLLFFGGRALTQEIVYMETYLDESVEGLEVGSPVSYRGVRIGRVDRIGFAADEYGIEPGTPEFVKYGRYVLVVMAIDVSREDERNTGVVLSELQKQGLRIRLKTHALTSEAYLEADYLDADYLKDNPPPAIAWEPRRYYLPSAPSLLETFTRTAEDAFRRLSNLKVEELVEKTDTLLVTLNKTVTDANVPEVSKDIRTLLTTVNTAVKDAKVGEVSRDLKKLIVTVEAAVKDARLAEVRKHAITLLEDADAAIKGAQVGQISTDVRALVAEVRQTNKHLATLLEAPGGGKPATLGKIIADLDRVIVRIDRMLKREGPAITRATVSIATVAEQLKRLVNDLERHPSRLLFGGPPARSQKVKP